MPYRLALDMGANSIGWCVLDLNSSGEPQAILDTGVRVFPDGRNPQDGSSLATMRRIPRQARRRRDRYLRRRGRLMQALIAHGLMPADESERKALSSLDPYDLRSRGINERLHLYELGRVIFHLNQRRGFLSNRKTDKGDKESGKIRMAETSLKRDMASRAAPTLGQYLVMRRGEGLSVRARPHGEGANLSYDFYPTRDLVEAEFDRLWEVQSRFHPALSANVREEIAGILFFQRPLRPVRPGKCTFDPTEERAPLALPVAQSFRIYQELANIRIVYPDRTERGLTVEERNSLALKLSSQKALTFDAMRKQLRLDSDVDFSLEDEKRKDLKGNTTGYLLSRKERFGKAWFDMSTDEQNEIVDLLLATENHLELMDILMNRWRLTEDQAAEVTHTHLPEGYSRLGRTALHKITSAMIGDVISYHEAVQLAGYSHHSDFRTGEILDEMPYYGTVLIRHVSFGTGDPAHLDEKRYGRVSNPTVHIGLNQLRKLLNALIKTYGHPAQVVLELARELKNSRERMREIQQEQAKNQTANDRRRDELRSLSLPINADNLLRLRLWEELAPDPTARRCVYTGEQISINRLFSADVEVDHILPFSRTLDNSTANLIVSLRRANQYKGRQSPFEAFGGSANGYSWEDIQTRASNLSPAKRRKFSPTAMAVFEEENGFLDRHLQDTQYLSRLVREYVCHVCDPNQTWVSPGRITSLLRRCWGLSKSRDDFRHHALDAAVIGVVDRSLLRKIASAAARNEETLQRVLADLPGPWETFRHDVEQSINRVIVSHKPDHGLAGALHNDIAYAVIELNGKEYGAHRIPIESIRKKNELSKIRSADLQAKLTAYLEGTDEKDFKAKISAFSRETGIRRARIIEPLTLIKIKDGSGRVYKGYKGDSNAFYEIFQRPDGRWEGEIVSTFDANDESFLTDRQRKNLPLVMRLFKHDMVAIGTGGDRRVMRIIKQSHNNITLAEHFETGNLKSRHEDAEDRFRYLFLTPGGLQKKGVRKISVDILGRLQDSGPRG